MSLSPIEPFVDPAIKELTQKSRDKLSSLLIALRRIRKSWIRYFEDFLLFLKKIQEQDPDLYIYHSYIKYLTDKLQGDLFERLYAFLASKGYRESELSLILSQKTFDEGAFINRLPKNNSWYLWLCIFYLYQPRLSQKFFWDKLAYLSSKDEEDILSNYRALPLNVQEKVSKYMQELAGKRESSSQSKNSKS